MENLLTVEGVSYSVDRDMVLKLPHMGVNSTSKPSITQDMRLFHKVVDVLFFFIFFFILH